ncbi:MAG: hypothetical protein ACLRW4_22875 [Ruminococcus sp.]
MKEKNHLFSATGIPSLFLIFGVLMLVILSLLGYGTSRQDLRASSLSLEQTSAYYNACSEAADFYSELVQTLEGFQDAGKNRDCILPARLRLSELTGECRMEFRGTYC